jgi:hypothetical protein
MSDRTYGETQNCAGCRYWSEMIARCNGGPVEAMCINYVSPNNMKYTTARTTCGFWASGHLGAVDEPGQDPRAYDVEHLPSDDTEGGAL